MTTYTFSSMLHDKDVLEHLPQVRDTFCSAARYKHDAHMHLE